MQTKDVKFNREVRHVEFRRVQGQFITLNFVYFTVKLPREKSSPNL